MPAKIIQGHSEFEFEVTDWAGDALAVEYDTATDTLITFTSKEDDEAEVDLTPEQAADLVTFLCTIPVVHDEVRSRIESNTIITVNIHNGVEASSPTEADNCSPIAWNQNAIDAAIKENRSVRFLYSKGVNDERERVVRPHERLLPVQPDQHELIVGEEIATHQIKSFRLDRVVGYVEVL